jgi:hypothetical protein
MLLTSYPAVSRAAHRLSQVLWKLLRAVPVAV